MYSSLPITRLRTLRATFIAALARPTLANRAHVERYLAEVERQLVIAAGPMVTVAAPTRRASLHDLRTGKAVVQDAFDQNRLQWAMWS